MTWSNAVEIAKHKKKSKRFVHDFKIPKNEIAHPSLFPGFRKDKGMPRGQRNDWRLRVGNGCLHVLEFRTHYLVHWDVVDPAASISKHFFYDALNFIFRFLAIACLVALAILIGG